MGHRVYTRREIIYRGLRVFLFRRRKLSERESRERNSVWKGTSADLFRRWEGRWFTLHKQPSVIYRNSLHGQWRYRFPSAVIECAPAHGAFFESLVEFVIRWEFVLFYFSVIYTKDTAVFGLVSMHALRAILRCCDEVLMNRGLHYHSEKQLWHKFGPMKINIIK